MAARKSPMTIDQLHIEFKFKALELQIQNGKISLLVTSFLMLIVSSLTKTL